MLGGRTHPHACPRYHPPLPPCTPAPPCSGARPAPGGGSAGCLSQPADGRGGGAWRRTALRRVLWQRRRRRRGCRADRSAALLARVHGPPARSAHLALPCPAPPHPSPCEEQVRFDPDATGPRHLLEAVRACGFSAEPYAEQRLGAACLLGRGKLAGCLAGWRAGGSRAPAVQCAGRTHRGRGRLSSCRLSAQTNLNQPTHPPILPPLQSLSCRLCGGGPGGGGSLARRRPAVGRPHAAGLPVVHAAAHGLARRRRLAGGAQGESVGAALPAQPSPS